MLVIVQLGNKTNLQIRDGVAHCKYKIIERTTNRMLGQHKPIRQKDEIHVADIIARALGGKIVFPNIGREYRPGNN